LSPDQIITRKDVRAADTATFLADLQATFFTTHRDYLRNELKYDGLLIGSNWITADQRLLGPLDKRSNALLDVMDRHGYLGGRHVGPRSTFSIDLGDTYFDRAAVRFDTEIGQIEGKQSFGLPIFDLQYDGKPSINSEIMWTPPGRFRADLPLLAAAYGNLQGSDGFCFFAVNAPGWQTTLSKFPVMTPAMMGQFPAAALAYRTGAFAQGPVVYSAAVDPVELEKLGGAPAFGPQNLDALREKDLPPGQAGAAEPNSTLDPLAFAVGRVEMRFEKGQTRQANLASFIDRPKRVVRSATGQLTWDYGKGVVTAIAPTAVGATGFLGAQPGLAVGPMTLSMASEYAAVMLVSLDRQPLETSRRMLLQVMTEETNNRWSATGDRERKIESLGGPPIVVKEIAGTVSFTGPVKITALDFNGRPAGDSQTTADLRLNASTLYYLVERQ
jgi:hypothetical protein